MRIGIQCESSITTEIEYERDGSPTVAILELAGGEWRMTPAPQAGWQNIGQGRIGWHEALKRALLILAPHQ